MSDQPFASIVVAAYNNQATIARCLKALQHLEYPDYEILVVDNASTDKTRTVISDSRFPISDCQDQKPKTKNQKCLVLLDEPRRGWPAARNRAWHYSKASLVANIDADCFAEPGWLAKLVAALLADAQAGCAVGRTKVEEGRTLAQRFYAASDPFNFEKFLPPQPPAPSRELHAQSGNRQSEIGNRNSVDTPSWGGGNNVVRREVIEAVGGYDAVTYTSGADREFHRRFEERTAYRTVYAPEARIWHVARGSAGEFFRVAAKYADDAVVHAQFDAGLRERVRGSVGRNLRAVFRNAAGLVYRGARFLVGRESALRAAQPFFWNVQALGTIWGTWRGRRRLRSLKNRRLPIADCQVGQIVNRKSEIANRKC